MIFLSHNSKDKRIVEPFANKLAEVFGREKVFYDSWSIQPGDGIIDKMESGLTEAKYFFFFVSENSLQSGMVKLEWQNAIMKATNGKVKFIPIRLDKSKMPTLLTQTLYLDVYQNGFDVVLRQMIDVINGVNTYRSSAETYENIKVKVKINEKEAEILFYAETYMEPISRYGIILANEEDDITWKCETDPMTLSGFNKAAVHVGSISYNVLAVTVQRATAPGFPVKIKVTSKTKMRFIGVMRAYNENGYKAISFKIVDSFLLSLIFAFIASRKPSSVVSSAWLSCFNISNSSCMVASSSFASS